MFSNIIVNLLWIKFILFFLFQFLLFLKLEKPDSRVEKIGQCNKNTDWR